MTRTVGMQTKMDLATATVRVMYAGFDVALLEQILAVGKAYDGTIRADEVTYMNEALAAEIERRKAER